jgi:hypothetical protein
MDILKEEHEINISDLLQFPAWEFAYDEMKMLRLSGRTMKPCVSPPPYDIHQNRIYTRATFQLSNGARMKGIITPIDLLSGLMAPILPPDLAPKILTENGRVHFWYGRNKPSEEEIQINYLWLGFRSWEVFPITVTCDVETINSISNGVIKGFLYSELEPEKEFFEMKEENIKLVT